MEKIKQKFSQLKTAPSDINEHLEFLKDLALTCNYVVEMGVRSVVSSWAFAQGLMENNSPNKKITCCDIHRSQNVSEFADTVQKSGIEFQFFEGNDLQMTIDPHCDLLFIDTWHIYGQLKRELETHHKNVKSYIVMHDTTVDGEHGETVRMGWNVDQQIKESGFTKYEVTTGLWPAIVEFLETHKEWTLMHRFTHNNGLTVLKRK